MMIAPMAKIVVSNRYNHRSIPSPASPACALCPTSWPPGGSTFQYSGATTSNSTTAYSTQAWRQPSCSISSATVGQDSVEAKPAISVTPVIARPAPPAYSPPRVANSASYKPMAMPTPITAQASRNTPRLWLAAINSSPSATTAPLAASCGRPPYRAISRLDNGASNAETNRLSDSAPYTHWLGQPVSRLIGAAITAIRKNEPPQTRICSTPSQMMERLEGTRTVEFTTGPC